MERGRNDDAQDLQSRADGQMLVAPPTALVTESEMSTPEFTAAVEAIKEIHKTGPKYTLFDLIDSPYGRRPPKGKTLHVVEHSVSLGNKRVAPRGTWTHTSRMKGAPQAVVSRILFPVASDDIRGEPWRRSGSAVVLDGCDHPAIRARMDSLVREIEAGKTFTGPPLGAGPRSRVGARDLEARNRFQLTLEHMTRVLQFWCREESTVVRGAIYVPITDQLGHPVVGMKVVAVNHDSHLTWETKSDARGLATFTDLPQGQYGVRAYSADGRMLVSAAAQPRDHEFRHAYFAPMLESTPMARYRELHRVARERGRRPSNQKATAWLTEFYPEFLEHENRRLAVLVVVRRQVSTGRTRVRPAYSTPRALAEALTAAFLGRTPSAIRKAIGPKPRPPQA